jgi:hypothetical protein
MQLHRLFVIVAMVCGVALCCDASQVAAQDEPAPLDAPPKGAIGFGLIGAELGVAIPALVGVDAWWAYLVFPAAGAAGGAVLGHFLVDNNDQVELSVIAMTAGIALVIPTLVLAMAATAYDPEEDRSSEAKLGPGLLRLDESGSLRVAAPGTSVVPSARAGKLHVSGLQMSMFSGRF